MEKHCPRLQQLFLIDKHHRLPDVLDPDADDGADEDDEYEEDEDEGLRVLHFDDALGRHGTFTQEDMMRYLIRHSDTIETLDMQITKPFQQPLSMMSHPLASHSVTFDNLVHLR